MTAAARARAAALSVEAKKDSLRQTQDGLWKITFTVSPTDMPAALMAARPGTRYMLALVEIGDDEEPVTSGPLAATPAASTQPPEETPKAPAKQRPAGAASQDKVVARAAILCGEPEFQRWLWDLVRKDDPPQFWSKAPVMWQQFAADAVRSHCRVTSRRDLAIDGDARKRFLALVERYEMDTGRRAERRSA